MMAAEILDRIQNVDPSDGKALDEIDALVWCFLYKKKFRSLHPSYPEKYGFWIDRENGDDSPLRVHFTQYTRSRDELKKIRPYGYEWFYKIQGGARNSLWHVTMIGEPEGLSRGAPLPTEELAELYAIIGAIAYERERQ